VKELANNGLDGCEEAGIAPVIAVTINADGITVTDNGPGIAAGTVADIIDYSSRTSSREAYVSPTRGAQGNALKSVLAMPFALDGNKGTVVIPHQSRKQLRIPCTVPPTPISRNSFHILMPAIFGPRSPGKTNPARFGIDSKIAIAGSLNGMRCSRPAFMRPAGIVQTSAAGSISSQTAPITSPDLAAVKIVNMSARAAFVSSAFSLAKPKALPDSLSRPHAWPAGPSAARVAAGRGGFSIGPDWRRSGTADRRPCEHRFDPATDPGRGFRPRFPQRVQDAHH
jgi:hypothetical protein